MNLMMLLEMAAAGHGDRVAITSGDRSLTYAELMQSAGAAASALEQSGAAHLALLDVNSPALPVALFASAWAGIPFAPLSYRLTGAETGALVSRLERPCLVTGPERRDDHARLPGVTAVARDDFLARAAAAASREPSWPMDPDAIAVLLFTSGTTGAPKAAVLRHRHLVSYILGTVEFGSADAGEAALVSVPPYHVAGIAAILSSVYAGRRIVQLESFDAEAWVATARGERVTNAFVVPTMLARIVRVLEREGGALPSLRALAYGGGKMPLPVIERAMELLPDTDFTNAYGLTETSSTIAVLGPEEHRAAFAAGRPEERRRLASVGRPVPTVEVQIRDEEGAPRAPGEPGEVCVRGEQVSGEYLGLASRVLADGWFPTRDGGWLDEEGYLFLEGRIDDVIVRGGENLSPGEIEDVILSHEAVADAAVVGVPDEQWGEAVVAVVVPREGRCLQADEIRDWVKRHMRSSRAPERVEVWDELPYNELGKLLRRRVRAALAGTSEA